MNLNKWLIRRSFNAKVRASVWKKVAVQIRHGITFYSAIEMLRDRARRKKKRVAAVYDHILRVSQTGGNIQSALVGWASSEEIMLISAGEKQDLAYGLRLAWQMLNSKGAIRKQVIGAAAYPIFLLLLCIGVLCIISFILVPEFTKMLPPERWTGVAGALLMLSDFVASVYGAAVGIAILVLAAVIFFTLPVWTGRLRVFADKYAPWSIYREVVGSSWLFSVATLMSAGIQPRQIFSENLASRTCSPYLRERISAIDYQMGLGNNLGESMSNAGMNFPSEDVVDDMCAYAQLPHLEEQITAIAEEQMENCIEGVKAKMKTIQTLMMFTVVGLILFVIISVFTLQSSLGQGGPGM